MCGLTLDNPKINKKWITSFREFYITHKCRIWHIHVFATPIKGIQWISEKSRIKRIIESERMKWLHNFFRWVCLNRVQTVARYGIYKFPLFCIITIDDASKSDFNLYLIENIAIWKSDQNWIKTDWNNTFEMSKLCMTTQCLGQLQHTHTHIQTHSNCFEWMNMIGSQYIFFSASVDIETFRLHNIFLYGVTLVSKSSHFSIL